jgi:hypothetical protein
MHVIYSSMIQKSSVCLCVSVCVYVCVCVSVSVCVSVYLPTHGIAHLCNFGCGDGCVATLYYGFNLHFSDDGLVGHHVLISHSHITVGEVFIPSCPLPIHSNI